MITASAASLGEAQSASPVTLEPKASVHLTQEGLLIEGGSAGQFTLNYPVLVGERWDDVRKPIEKKVSGNTATLQFEGPTRIEVVWQPAEGTLSFTPISVPTGVLSLRAEMLIDFSYVTGGSWQIGPGKETPFPALQLTRPHLFQGNAEKLELRNFEGTTLTIQVPPHSFQQLTDNREWGWKIFAWQFSAPCASAVEPLRVKIALGAPAGEAVKLVDRFGQSTRSEFPAKVRTEEELKQDLQTEAAWLANPVAITVIFTASARLSLRITPKLICASSHSAASRMIEHAWCSLRADPGGGNRSR